MSTLVVDASVGAKWYLPASQEPHRDAADRIVRAAAAGNIQIAVPDLFWNEIANVFWTAVRRRQWEFTAAEAAVEHALTLGLRTVASRELLPDALAIANTCGCTVYDALYVALADQERSTFVTADERLVKLLAGDFPVRCLRSL